MDGWMCKWLFSLWNNLFTNSSINLGLFCQKASMTACSNSPSEERIIVLHLLSCKFPKDIQFTTKMRTLPTMVFQWNMKNTENTWLILCQLIDYWTAQLWMERQRCFMDLTPLTLWSQFISIACIWWIHYNTCTEQSFLVCIILSKS